MRLLMALCALCACLLGFVQGSKFFKPVPEHPDQPGKCLYKGMAIAVGKSVTEHSSCTKLTCSKRDKGQSPFAVEGLGCNHAASWPNNCHMKTPDQTKNFPGCCPQLECDGAPEGVIASVG